MSAREEHTSEVPPPRIEEPGIGPPPLTARQNELVEGLAGLDPELAGLYTEGIRLLARIDDPGVAPLVAHVGRELTLGVIQAVIDDGWSAIERELSEIPANEKYRAKIGRSLGLDPKDPVVSQWFELHNETFVTTAHLRRGRARADPNKLRVGFGRLEEFLFGRVGPYFRAQGEIDELLKVNEPDDTHLEQLLTIRTRPQLRRYFFNNLRSAAWLSPLDQIGVFGRPPGLREHDDGSWQPVAWPEGQFLCRIASDEPEGVVDILERLPTTIENPGVWRVVCDVANQVPPNLGQRLVSQLVEATTKRLPVLFADGLLTLIPRITEVDQNAAFHLAEALLFVPHWEDVGDISRYSSRSDWMFPRLRWLNFSEFVESALPPLEQVDAERCIELLLSKLTQLVSVARRLGLMHTALLGDSRGHPNQDDVAGQLFHAFSEILGRFASNSPVQAERAWKLLGKQSDETFTKLRYRLLATAGHNLQDELNAFVSSAAAVEGGLGREIPLILRQQYSNASQAARRVFVYSLVRGPDAEVVKRYGRLKDPTLEDIDEAKREWQARRLTWFRGEIPDDLRDLAESLGMWGDEPSIKDQELAEVGSYSSGGGSWGEPRPFSHEDLSARSPAELVRLIIEWEPGAVGSMSGTSRGLQLSIQELAAADPRWAFAIAHAAGDDLPSRFSQSLLDGLRDAIDTEGFDWVAAVQAVHKAIDQAVNPVDAPIVERLGLIRSATDLIRDGVRKDLLADTLEDEVWSTLTSVILNPLIWRGDTEEFASFGGLLNTALNRVASRTVETVLLTGLWTYRLRENEDASGATQAAEARIAPILDHVLTQSGADRVTAEAIIGQFLPQLQLIAPQWLQQHLNGVLSDGAAEPFEHPAWGAYITRARIYDSMFNQLRPWYVRAAEAAGTDTGRVTSNDDSWSLTEGLTRHVLIAVLRGLTAVGDPDRLVELTFANAPPAERGKSYWMVFRNWTDMEEDPPDEFIHRLVSFWEWRLGQLETSGACAATEEEAAALGWLFKTPYLPSADVLRLGVRTAKAATGGLEAHTDWERMRELAEEDPNAAFEIAELVLRAQLAKEHAYIPTEEVFAFLELALTKVSTDVRPNALRLVHRLGEAGYDGFRSLADS